MRIDTIRPIDPIPSRCIEVDSGDRLFASGGLDGVSFVTHNSVAQRNIIFGTILRPQHWKFLGIDLKRVELSSFRKYSNVVLGVATTLEDALTILRFANETMMKRYTQMEQMNINNFINLPDRGQALLVMVDEAGELLSPSGVKTEDGKADDALKGEASMIIGSIARLGRAAGVHLVIATQRPDATIIAGETRANLSVRVACGRTKGTASSMILENSEGTRIRSNPRGRLYVQIDGNGDHGQGFYAEEEWLDEFLRSQGKAPDGSPLAGFKQSKLAKLTDMSTFEETDLDSQTGVDNDSIIERIRQQEAAGIFEEDEENEEFEYADDDGDWGIESNDEDDEEGIADRSAQIKAQNEAAGFGGLELKGDSGNTDKWKRAEDDWDDDLENLINENFD